MLSQARSITAVSDRESDFYELFARRPGNVELIVRACQNRRIETPAEEAEGLLFDFIDGQPEQGRFAATIPAAPGRPERDTELALRFAPVTAEQAHRALQDQQARWQQWLAGREAFLPPGHIDETALYDRNLISGMLATHPGEDTP